MGAGQTRLGSGLLLGLALGGCNSFDAKPPDPNEPQLVIPVDERETVTSAVTPRAISGGTLTVTADGKSAIVADPDRDSVTAVDLSNLTVKYTVQLQAGDEPGRSVEDADKRVHIALRRSGAVVTLDEATGTVVDRRAVCKSPRGIAFDAATKLVHVACAEGKLVSLDAQSGAVTRTLSLDTDLRDVLVRGTELWVTRFKSAEMLRVSSTGTMTARISIPDAEGVLAQPAPKSEGDFAPPSDKPVTVKAGVAYRAVPTSTGGAVIVHQQAVTDDIDITAPSTQGSAYGGGGIGCSGIVKNSVSVVSSDGSVKSSPFEAPPLPVDVAVSPDQNWVAVAQAGPADQSAPRPFVVFPNQGDAPSAGASTGGRPTSSLTIMSLANVNGVNGCNNAEGGGFFNNQPVTAVAFAPDGRLVAQTMDPPQLLVVAADQIPWGTPAAITLPGDSRADTGHDLFHRDAGGGIACASCHPEGGEDGNTWHFSDTGARRTQALHIGLRDTAPFHWAGDLKDVNAVMSEVFVGRMGGAREDSARVDALSNWLFALTPPPALRDSTDAAAVRGKALFDSPSVGCTTCHTGAKLTNNQSVAIDSVAKQKFQVPSLVAVGYRAPFMHTGCASTLTARFDVACGGNAHGNTSQLKPEEIGDLVAYLETL